MFPRFAASFPVVFLCTAFLAPLSAQEKMTYNDHVLPIFRNACLNCHNPDKKKAGLDLSTYQGTLQGGENGKVLDSGNPSGSLLFKCIKGTEEPKMPPKGDKVSDGDLAIIEKWIAGQLLETATGKAVAASKNNVQAAVVSLTRPDGPPPMPGELPLEPFLRTKAANALTALAVSPWAPVVAIGGQKQIVLYNVETLEPLGVLPFPEGFPAIIKFSRNGQLLLTGGGLGGKSGKVALWDIKTGDRIGTVGNEFDQVLAADLSADQQFVALGGPNKLVKIYATKDGKLVTTIKKHTDWVTAIAYSPEGKYLATADRNGGIQVWEGSTGKEFNVLPGHKVMVTGLAFMTGVLASSSEDGKIALWDVKEAKEIRSWNAHAGGAAWVDFTPDGRLVSCGRDKIAKAWDQSGKELGKSQPFADIALRAGLSNDRIIAGDWTGAIRVCAFDGKPLGELTANPPMLADRIALAEKKATDAQAALPGLQQQFAALEQKLSGEKAAQESVKTAAGTALDAWQKKLEQQNADVARLREIRATKTDGTPEWVTANNQVQTKKAEIAETQAKLAVASATPEAPAPAKPLPAEEELAKAKAALEVANTQIASARSDLERWKLARVFQSVHDAKQTLTARQAQFDGFVAAAKDAFAPIDKAESDIAAAEKTRTESPAKLKEKELKLADARGVVDSLSKAVASAQTALAEKEKALTAMNDAAKTGANQIGELSKKVEALTAEIAQRREIRAAKPAETPEYAEADAKVQAIKPEIAQAESALAAAKAQAAAAESPETKTVQLELTKIREALEKTRAEIKAAGEAASGAEQALAATKKAADQAAKQFTELRAKLPEITKAAHAAKLAAERAAASAEAALAAAKTEAAGRRAAYEAAKNGGVKSAALVLPPPKM